MGAAEYGRMATIFFEWSFVFVLDQLKSCLMLPFLWWAFVRHCGKLQPGFETWNDETVALGATDDSFLDDLRRNVGMFLESK
jgi:hypothetical protein